MKNKNLLLLSIFCALFTGCESTAFKTQKEKIQLGGNPTTGYTWSYEIGDASVISVEEDVKYLGKNGIVGAPSLFTYTIHSLKEGNTTLKFEYKRSWETNPPEETHLYIIEVLETGKIIITEKTAEE